MTLLDHPPSEGGREKVLEEAAKVCRHCKYGEPFRAYDGTYGHHFAPEPNPIFCYKCKATAIWEAVEGGRG